MVEDREVLMDVECGALIPLAFHAVDRLPARFGSSRAGENGGRKSATSTILCITAAPSVNISNFLWIACGLPHAGSCRSKRPVLSYIHFSNEVRLT